MNPFIQNSRSHLTPPPPHPLPPSSAMYLASYPIAASLCCFPSWPDKIVCNGVVDSATGIDTMGSISLRFPPLEGGDESKSGERLDNKGAGMVSENKS